MYTALSVAAQSLIFLSTVGLRMVALKQKFQHGDHQLLLGHILRVGHRNQAMQCYTGRRSVRPPGLPSK